MAEETPAEDGAMAAPWAKKQEISAFEDFDFDELLAQLTPEEIEILANETDPDNSLLPPSERQGNQTSKLPTGPLNRDALLKWLEEKAKAERDWEEAKPFSKEKRGKAFIPKQLSEEPLDFSSKNSEVKTDFDEILNKATEEELVDLAAALGFHSILNQDQYNASMADKPIEGGFRGVAKATVPVLSAPVAPNDTDVEAAIEKLSKNDPSLTELNLNNIKNISAEKFERLFKAFESNTNLKIFAAASTDMTDAMARKLAESLKANRSLSSVILDSNFIKRDAILQLVESVSSNENLRELSLENQKPLVLGVKTEQAIAALIEKNHKMEKLGIQFETLNARIRVQEKLKSNYDQHRKMRSTK